MTRNEGKQTSNRHNTILGTGALALAALLTLSSPLFSQDSGSRQAAPTFSADIVPILQKSCQGCHNENGIGPMPLLTYEQVRRFAALIKQRVQNRVMPPWHLDRTIGIQQYKNDTSLTDRQIETIVQWVDAGTPEGDRASLPPPLEFPKGDAWQLGERLGPPDVVVRSTPYTVKANGQDQWWNPVVDFAGFDKPRWLRAAEFKPSFPLGKRVVHHGHAYYYQEGQGSERETPLTLYGVGRGWEMFAENTGIKLEAGPAQIHWNLHYFPIREEVRDDVVEVGLWFYPTGGEPDLQTGGEVRFVIDQAGHPRGADILIPPHGYQTIQTAHVLSSAAQIHSFRPHMHMRGSGMSMEAVYPDGRKEVLSSVDRYNHNWQIAYEYADDVQPLLPKGTVLLFHAFFDNTSNNPLNPDPDQWVLRGQRGVDEMSHAWVGITYLTDEEFDRLAGERKSKVSSPGR
jgi:hypothetical protein